MDSKELLLHEIGRVVSALPADEFESLGEALAVVIGMTGRFTSGCDVEVLRRVKDDRPVGFSICISWVSEPSGDEWQTSKLN